MEFGRSGGTIGRSLESDWVLPDGQRYLSSRHASIDYRSGSYYVVDTSTNGVYVNDAEPGLVQDFQDWLKSLVDVNKDYRHNLTGEDNTYAHLMRTLMGREAVVAVTGGKLDFGPWEQIYYAEFDGRRKKRVLVKILGE